MLRLNMEVFYPYPPQRVWQVLTNRQALAVWLMENDFEPRLGHKFRFVHSTLPGLEGDIDCQVIELDEPRRLAFTWQDSMMCQPSVVTWTIQ
ncbi:SRPBCC family protein [Nostoc sp.]